MYLKSPEMDRILVGGFLEPREFNWRVGGIDPLFPLAFLLSSVFFATVQYFTN